MLFCGACPDHLSFKSSKASDYSVNLVCDRHNRICAINLTRQCYSSRTKWLSPHMPISAASDVIGRSNARRWIACKAEGEKQAKHKRVKFKDGREFSPIINVRSRFPCFWSLILSFEIASRGRFGCADGFEVDEFEYKIETEFTFRCECTVQKGMWY